MPSPCPRRWGSGTHPDETGRRRTAHRAAALLRADAVRPQDRRRRPHHRFRCGLPRDHRAGGERGRPRADSRRRGEGRRRHPQADVRAADAVPIRRRRHHRRQSQRLLRAWHPPRHAAALHGDPVRGRHDAAVRHRAAARHSVSDQRGRRAVRPGRLLRDHRQAIARGEGKSARRQSAVPASGIHAAPRGRPHQDRHVPRTLRLFQAVQGAPRRGPQQRRARR